MAYKLKLPPDLADKIRKGWNIANGEVEAGEGALDFLFGIADVKDEEKTNLALRVGILLGRQRLGGPNVNGAANFIEEFEKQILNAD